MASYKERIMQAIEDSNSGLTTVDVAKRAGVSKTTVIKYLSVLRSEGRCEFVEVGPSKLWKVMHPQGETDEIDSLPETTVLNAGALIDADAHCIARLNGQGCETISISFKVRPDELCALMKKAKKCVCH
jgi:hypothetical protein